MTVTDTERPAGTNRDEWDLAGLLAHRRWVRREQPFPHVVAQNVFVPEFYQQLHDEFLRVERDNPHLFERSMKGYDASATDLRRHQNGPLGIFVSRAWHDLMAGAFGVEGTGDVAASIHHHDAGSATGWPHHDLAPGWFPGPRPPADQVRLTDMDAVDYYHGPGERRTVPPPRETVRAVSLLFYLGNPEWEPGDGGETALFASVGDAHRGPSATVPPVNNSLVMFECTPFSWHTFLTNRKPRNSVVMWVHRDKADAVARWGEQSIVPWP